MFEIPHILALLLFAGVFVILISGFPVVFSLAGTAVIFAGLGVLTGDFSWVLLSSIPGRIVTILVDETLVAVPLFVFMGVVLEKSKLAEDLLVTMGQLFGDLRGGLAISVVLVGALLAASTGIVGATVITMGLISLPAMTKAKYDPKLSSGVICASGTLAQLIPPSTVLILLGIMLQNANSQANMKLGKFGGDVVTSTDLFAAAMLPGLVLVTGFIAFVIYKAIRDPASCPAIVMTEAERNGRLRRVLVAALPTLTLILVVLGSILTGIATATESAALGALGAMLLALLKRKLTIDLLWRVSQDTLQISVMVYAILIGSTFFSLVFRGLGGEDIITDLIRQIPGGQSGAVIFVLALMFLLGFILDTFEIIFIVVPIFAPALFILGVDPIWLGTAMAIVLQTSYLTPPFGFALFYLQGVAPQLRSIDIMRGVIPFVLLQLFGVVAIWFVPELATWLPKVLFG
ncbi:TRAP transporter large permease subunit [Ferrovibrio sp.]|uniref:TRAP transporter large permease n=1 Tax=Ferrovibrio sp. TaxID=1917215 RepID=UPI001B57CE9B|nr:TRAP transporter large permease subunit [Ferrovibrio sp.]MBP7065028.1 TRAP transporter large permease subunit [Ferrovibrio sp.]